MHQMQTDQIAGGESGGSILEAYLATLTLICANKKFLKKSEVCLHTQHSNVIGQLGLHSILLEQLQLHTAFLVSLDVVLQDETGLKLLQFCTEGLE